MAKHARVPQQARSARTRERIIAGAQSCFASRGYDLTQTRDIAAAAQVSVGTFYEYFADKATVFRSVLDSFQAALELLDIEGELIAQPGRAGWVALLSKLRDWVLPFGRLFRDFYTLGIRDTGFEEALNAFESSVESKLRKLLEETVLRGSLSIAPSVVELVYAIIESTLVRLTSNADDETHDSMLREASICLDAYSTARAETRSG